MNYSYFPGCTLRTKGAQLDRAGRRAAEKLGFSLCEIPEWQCCGAVYPRQTMKLPHGFPPSGRSWPRVTRASRWCPSVLPVITF
mgnify:CR=1 FL=1